ncbi:MAG: hypothetical protein PHH70_05800 [Candidatus Gracilibacteria bacterium]|nr:hypothetical protein [Candidatus Gracilibacteria bacterium]
MIETTSMHAVERRKSFFAGKYFGSTPTGLSAKNATKFPNPRKNPTNNADGSLSPKKNTSVKGKHIQTKDEMNP